MVEWFFKHEGINNHLKFPPHGVGGQAYESGKYTVGGR